MDHSGFDIEADLPQRGARSQAARAKKFRLTRVTDRVLREATRLETVKPRRNRYAIFAGDLLHGVLDARGRTPSRPLAGPHGRLRVTLVVNYWQRRPTGVPGWSESGMYRALR